MTASKSLNVIFPWLTQSYMENVLRKYYKDPNLDVQCISLEYAASAGDSYCGIVLRVFVEFDSKIEKCKKKSFIVKTIVWDQLSESTLKNMYITQKEIFSYDILLPAIKALLSRIGEGTDHFPDTVYVNYETETLIMEDLTPKGYIMKNRLKGLDRDHVLIAMKKLAQVHAASAVLHEKNKEIYDMFTFGQINPYIESFHTYFYNFFDACCDAVASWPGYTIYAIKLKELRKTFIQTACKAVEHQEDDLRVFNHGDMWINNAMFSYDSNKNVQNMMLFDYQYGVFATPFVDLFVFIYSSTDDQTRSNPVECLQVYYKHLKATLKSLKYGGKIPTLFEFRQEYVRRSFMSKVF